MGKLTKGLDTEYYTFFNANPKQNNCDDCVARTISVAMDMPWEEVVRQLTETGIRLGYMLNEEPTYTKFLKENGWKIQKQPRKSNGKKYTGEEFCKEFQIEKAIAHIGKGHIVAIKNHKIIDTWNCSKNCIGKYWVKER